MAKTRKILNEQTFSKLLNSQHMGLCDNHHAQEQEDDAVTGGRHGPRDGIGS